MKKEWQTPELIVLFRGRPEEDLLTACKYKNIAPLNPGTGYKECKYKPTPISSCKSCYSKVKS